MKFKVFLGVLMIFGAHLTAETQAEPEVQIENIRINDVECFNEGIKEVENKQWDLALECFSSVREFFQDSSVYDDALYFQAVCNYHMGEYLKANEIFTSYLGNKFKLKFFEDALNYKLEIANKFKEGERKYLFASSKFPKWISAREDALELYDEVIELAPSLSLAAEALYEKGSLLKDMQDYKTSLDCFHKMLKRFPKHSLAPSAYLAISEAYYEQSHCEFRDGDLLDSARLNLNKFTQNYPRDERIEQVRNNLDQMQEIHAKGLYDIGLYYERTKKPKASVIYYVTALEKFPNAPTSKKCRARLDCLNAEAEELQVKSELLK